MICVNHLFTTLVCVALHCVKYSKPSDQCVQGDCICDITGGMGVICHERQCNNWLNSFKYLHYIFITMLSKIILAFKLNEQYYVNYMLKFCCQEILPLERNRYLLQDYDCLV